MVAGAGLDTKSSKKKKAKAEVTPNAPAGTAAPAADATSPLPEAVTNGTEHAGDSPYMKELSK